MRFKINVFLDQFLDKNKAKTYEKSIFLFCSLLPKEENKMESNPKEQGKASNEMDGQ